MKRGTSIPALLFVALAASGCQPSMAESFARWGGDRAAFELNCPRQDLRIVGLNGRLDGRPYEGAQVGVTGCGRRAVYVLTRGTGWILNSIDGAPK